MRDVIQAWVRACASTAGELVGRAIADGNGKERTGFPGHVVGIGQVEHGELRCAGGSRASARS